MFCGSQIGKTLTACPQSFKSPLKTQRLPALLRRIAVDEEEDDEEHASDGALRVEHRRPTPLRLAELARDGHREDLGQLNGTKLARIVEFR